MPAYVMLVTCQQYTVLARRTDRQEKAVVS